MITNNRKNDIIRSSLNSNSIIIVINIIIIVVSVIEFALSMVIMSKIRNSASIAVSELGDGFSINGFLIGILTLKFSHLMSLIAMTIVAWYSIAKGFWTFWIYLIYLACSTFFIYLTSEIMIFKFITSFNTDNNNLIVARSCISILLVVIFFVLSLLHFFSLRNAEEEDSNQKKFCLNLFSNLFLVTTAVIVIIINCFLLARIGPQLNDEIGPNNIFMGLFNSREIDLIQKSEYSEDHSFENRIIGRLSEVIFSSNKLYSHKKCGGRRKCNKLYWHTYRFDIECSKGKADSFFQDCENSYSLTFDVKYLDDGPYPTYNCAINTVNRRCASNCNQLASSDYKLILFQQFNGFIEPAWSGFSSSKLQPNITLIYDSTINPCSLALKLKNTFGIYKFIFFMYYYVDLNV